MAPAPPDCGATGQNPVLQDSPVDRTKPTSCPVNHSLIEAEIIAYDEVLNLACC